MQNLVKGLFDLERAWMRSNDNHRWVIAAMGVAVQMAQGIAYQRGESTWRVQARVLDI